MLSSTRSTVHFSRFRRVLLCCLLFLAVDACAAPTCAQTRSVTSIRHPIHYNDPLLAESRWSWRKLYNPLETALSSRARMIQFGIIGMCIALYIIVWRK